VPSVHAVRFVCVSEILGGGELYLLRIARAAAERLDVSVVGSPGTPVLAAAGRLGLETTEVPLGRKLGRRSAAHDLLRYAPARRALRALVASGGRGTWTLLQYKWDELLWAGAPAPERVALWEHGPLPGPLLRVPWSRRRLVRAFARAAQVFAWSEPARRAILDLCGRAPQMLEPGVDPAAAASAVEGREETRERLGVSADEMLLVYSGRLAGDKGVDLLLRALPRLPRAHAVVCGTGPAATELERLAATMGVGDRIRFTGFVEDPLPLLAAADVAVLLSRSPGEGRPLVAIEAGAVGTPVLGLAGSPALERLAEEGRARLAPNGAPEAVSRCLEEMARQPRRTFPAPRWEATAGRFLDALEQAG
jgi:glycosyltransferase involved in cell wall biosynthesis